MARTRPRGSAAPTNRGLGDGEVGNALGGVKPVGFGDAERFEHRLGPQPARGERNSGGAVRGELVPEGERGPAVVSS
jgi:hypothetical protein